MYTRIVLSAQYVMCFGVMGVMLPYFNLYCYHIQLSGFQIGIIGASRSLIMILFGLLWGLLADHYQNRRFIYILCQFVYAGFCIFLLQANTFPGILLVIIVASIFYSPLISFMEAFTMDLIGNDKNAYGSIRLWGSIFFILMALLSGKLLNHFSHKIIIEMIVAGAFIQAFVSLSMPKTRGKKLHEKNISLTVFMQSNVIVYLISAFTMLLAHGTYYAFSSIHLEQMGATSNEIAMYWALGSIAEIIVMMNARRIFNRFSVESVLVFSFAIAAMRWFLMFYTTSVLIAIMTQLFHAVTYGAFHIAGILYMDRCMPDETKTTGQAVNTAVSYGLGMMTGSFVNGYLFEFVGTYYAFLFSAVLSFIAGLLLWTAHKLLMSVDGQDI
jgi:PPP family 3-phenylpropionic acid transporter